MTFRRLEEWVFDERGPSSRSLFQSNWSRASVRSESLLILDRRYSHQDDDLAIYERPLNVL